MLDAEFNAQIGQFIGRTFSGAQLIDVQQLTAGASQQTFRVSVRHQEVTRLTMRFAAHSQGLSVPLMVK